MVEFDELEWVRAVIDRWLSENAIQLALVAAVLLALASLLAST